MVTAWEVFQASVALLLVYGVAGVLRWKNILKPEHEKLLTALLMNICIPAAIFTGLARQPIQWHLFFGPLVMYCGEIFGGLVAFLVGAKLLKLKPAQTGTLILCCAFGSATTVGMAFIEELYQGHLQAFTEAIISAQLGVAFLIFVAGAPVAIYFGNLENGGGNFRAEILRFFYSPIFIALVVGLVWNVLKMPGASDEFMGPIFKFLGLLQGAIALLAGLAVGLLFRPVSIRLIAGSVITVVAIKLIIIPLFIGGTTAVIGLEPMWRGVLIVLSAMPTAVIAALFAKKYGCDAGLASVLIIVSTVVSVLTLPLIYKLSMHGF